MILVDTGPLVALFDQRTATIDRRDFATYRIRRGHRHYSVELVT
jgi:predicted nucleic acid-binding protein